jgi:hypothetical protein
VRFRFAGGLRRVFLNPFGSCLERPRSPNPRRPGKAETTFPGSGKKSLVTEGFDGGLSSWPVALRHVRAWLEPGVMLWRYWRGWSDKPPPPALQRLLDWLWQGRGIELYI